MKPTPGPWDVQLHDGCQTDTTYYAVHGPNGKAIFDTCNSEDMEIYTEHDEFGANHWDEQGRVNMQLAAAAPDLLEALQAFMDYIPGRPAGGSLASWIASRRTLKADAIKKGWAALKKAGMPGLEIKPGADEPRPLPAVLMPEIHEDDEPRASGEGD